MSHAYRKDTSHPTSAHYDLGSSDSCRLLTWRLFVRIWSTLAMMLPSKRSSVTDGVVTEVLMWDHLRRLILVQD